jgi:hypothetical protein
VYSANFSTISVVLCVCFVYRCLFFCTFFLLAIVLSVRLRYTDYDYNLFLWYLQTHPIIFNRTSDVLKINLVVKRTGSVYDKWNISVVICDTDIP